MRAMFTMVIDRCLVVVDVDRSGLLLMIATGPRQPGGSDAYGHGAVNAATSRPRRGTATQGLAYAYPVDSGRDSSRGPVSGQEINTPP